MFSATPARMTSSREYEWTSGDWAGWVWTLSPAHSPVFVERGRNGIQALKVEFSTHDCYQNGPRFSRDYPPTCTNPHVHRITHKFEFILRSGDYY